MASFTDTIAILIKADGAKAAAEFKKVGDSAKKELDKAEGATKNYSAMFTKLGVGLTTTAAIGGVALYKLGQDASDLAETMNKSSVIFGESADEVSKFGDTAADKLGQSKQAAVDAASTFGALAKGVGLSQDASAKFGITLTSLASDMASFGNTSPDEAVLALGSALRGESEPIRKYNVLLNETAVKAEAARLGLVKQGQELSEGAKVQARYSLILKQTSDQQGDFARTSDGAANQQRILTARMDDLRAKIGAGVLPAMTQLLSVVSSGVDVFSSMDEATGGMVGKIATIGVAASGVIGGLSLIAGQARKARDALTTMGDDGVRSLNNVGRAAKGIAVAGGLLALAAVVKDIVWADAVPSSALIGGLDKFSAGLLKNVDGAQAARLAIDSLGSDVQKFFSELEGPARENTGVLFFDQFPEMMGGVSRALLGTEEDFTRFIGKVRELQPPIEGVTSNADLLETSLGSLRSQLQQNAAASLQGLIASQKLTRAQYDAAVAAATGADGNIDYVKALRSVPAAQDRAAGATDRHGRSLKDLITIAQDYRDRVLGMNDSTRDWASAQLDVADANARVGEAQKAMNEAIAEYGPDSAEAAQSTRDYQRAIIEASQSQDDAKRRVEEHAASLAGYDLAGENSRETNRKFRDSLREVAQTLAPGDPLRQYLLGYADDLKNKVPDKKSTDISTPGIDGARSGAQGLARDIDNIPDSKSVSMSVNVTWSGNIADLPLGGLAKGGPVRAGKPYIVGEEGPELFISNQPGVIIPNHKMQTATGGRPLELSGAKPGGGGDVINIHFHGPVASQRQAEDWVTNALASARRRGAA